MQVSISNIRCWGNNKILNSFYNTDSGKKAFYQRLLGVDTLLLGFKDSAFSVAMIYNTIYPALRNEYYGFVRFMNYCEPLISSIDTPDITIKRRIRNQWGSLWRYFQKDTGISDDVVSVLKSLGIKLVYNFLVSGVVLDSEVYDFYNSVISWYIYTISESAILSLDFEPFELLGLMTYVDSDKFVYYLLKGFDQKGDF